jgi:cytochrome b6-f complex iron-sulfur subunit
MTSRRLRRYVEDLLRGRRPRIFRPHPDEAGDLRTAITLRAARPGSDAPSEEFVTGLHRRLAAELAPGGEATRSPRPSRRQAVRVASVAAAGVAVGAAGGAALDRLVAGPADAAPLAQPTLQPNVGTWHTVAAVADVAGGGVRGFDVGTVKGFVGRTADGLRAVSGVCTHLGCLLALDAPSRQLVCPCHNATFAVTGQLVRHQLATPPPPLPQIAVREAEGAIQIFAP